MTLGTCITQWFWHSTLWSCLSVCLSTANDWCNCLINLSWVVCLCVCRVLQWCVVLMTVRYMYHTVVLTLHSVVLSITHVLLYATPSHITPMPPVSQSTALVDHTSPRQVLVTWWSITPSHWPVWVVSRPSFNVATASTPSCSTSLPPHSLSVVLRSTLRSGHRSLSVCLSLGLTICLSVCASVYLHYT